MTFGEKLQKLRKEKGWTQEQLASQISVSRQSLSKWELDASLPDTEHIIQLSKLFNVSTDYLLMEETANDHKQSPDNSLKIRLVAGSCLALIALLGILIIGILASVYPASHLVFPADENWVRVYNGLLGFLMVHNLEWLFILLIVLFISGILILFYPKIRFLLRKE